MIPQLHPLAIILSHQSGSEAPESPRQPLSAHRARFLACARALHRNVHARATLSIAVLLWI